MQLVHKQYKTAMMEMQQSSKSGKGSSLSLDEYLSPKHKRYQNINVYQHKDKFWKFGMEAISENENA